MIELGVGNLLECEAEALVNTVNCVGVMGKGIALQFKRAFPENFRRYAQACRQGLVQPGKMFVVETDLIPPRYIINFPTKTHWKAKSHLKDIQAGLDSLIAEIQERGIGSIAVPPLGCGNGGLDWGAVHPLIETAFAGVPGVRVHLYAPAGAPAPGAMPIGTEKPRMTRVRALLIRLLDRYGIPGYESSLIEIQKLAYFLQEAGEPLGLDFVKGKFGPYAENLRFSLEHMEGHYLRGLGDMSQQSEIRVLPGATSEADAFLAADPDARERVNRVSDLIEGFETPYGMELLATVHWATRKDAEAAQDVERAVPFIHAWSPRKRMVFKADHIKTAWAHLRDRGWIRPPSGGPGAAT